MSDKILDFLKNQRVCSLTTLLADNSPHSAALHFSHIENPFEFYFSTENTSRKCQAMLSGNSTMASVVIGFSEEEWITIQLDGTASIVSDLDELRKIQSIHYAKHPNSAKYKDDPATVFIKFTPNWWRYTDYNTQPLTILSSDN